jgi:hypothetical protein
LPYAHAIRASYGGDKKVQTTMTATKQFSKKNQYLHLTTTTVEPTVGKQNKTRELAKQYCLFMNQTVKNL